MSQLSDLDDVKTMENEAKYRIIFMREKESNSQCEQILSDLCEKITILYEEFRLWLEDVQERETIKRQKAWLKEENERLLANACEQISKLKESDDVKQAVNKGIQVATTAGTWVYDTINAGFKEVMKQETAQKINAEVSYKVRKFKEDERVKQGVSSLKKHTLKFAESAYLGLKKVLDEAPNEGETEVIENEKNNNL